MLKPSNFQGVIQKIFLGGGSMEMCGQNCDQVLIEAAGDLYSIHTLVSCALTTSE